MKGIYLMNSIVLEHVSKSFDNGEKPLIILDKASYSFKKGTFYSIVGRSGLGKTTLVSMIGTVENPDSGKIKICGRYLSDVTKKQLTEIRRNDIGFIFQNYSLIERYSVYENLEIPLFFAGIKNADKRQKMIIDTLKLVGIPDEKLYKEVTTLSGGEKQRIAICRALLNSPSVIIADEPTGNLDEQNEKNIISIFMKIKQEKNCTIIMVTHNMKVAKQADVMLTIDNYKIKEEKK